MTENEQKVLDEAITVLSAVLDKFKDGTFTKDETIANILVVFTGKVTVKENPKPKIFNENPIAKTLAELVTAKQLGMMRALARELRLDVEETCFDLLACKTDELHKRSASAFIGHLMDLSKQQETDSVF